MLKATIFKVLAWLSINYLRNKFDRSIKLIS